MNKRRRVIQELLETEISYSKDLQLLKEVHAQFALFFKLRGCGIERERADHS